MLSDFEPCISFSDLEDVLTAENRKRELYDARCLVEDNIETRSDIFDFDDEPDDLYDDLDGFDI